MERCYADTPLGRFREGLNLTFDALAAETGASKSKLWRIENRRQDPDMELLRRLDRLAKRKGVAIRFEDFLSSPPMREAAE